MTSREHVHPAVSAARERMYAADVVEIARAVGRDKVVVLGMAWNVPVKNARRTLQAEDIGYTYLEFGNYITGWRRRLAIKIWAGWPTFPMVFINGALVGGASDLDALRKSGELKRLLAEQSA
jgi:monothiol glutaredoxin